MSNNVHFVKCLPQFFIPILTKQKTFEIRKNDRLYKVGDYLVINEWNNEIEDFTGRDIRSIIIYMTDFEQKEGYVVLGIMVLL